MATERVGEKILAVDIGGTGLKAALVDRKGRMLTERVRVETPRVPSPEAVLKALDGLVRPLGIGAVIGVSVGFPGVVRGGKIVTAPNLGTERWAGTDLAKRLQSMWKKPVRVVNDADMQALGASKGKGLEVVVTLGTGFGSGMVIDGRLAPHLEISHHPFRKGEDYDQQIGNLARKKIGNKKWNHRVAMALENVRILTNYDHLYVGGGNTKHLTLELPANVHLVANDCGVRGGAKLWDD